jgi:uracil-DNA glycosylase
MQAEPEPNDARPFLPKRPTLQRLSEAAAGCRGCHLWRDATQTVFGEGLKRSRMMLVSEMPGDREDREGRPFVGPAGRELDRALEAAEIDRRDVYVTNVVKHFKFERRGARRLHQTPKRFEVEACRPWLEEELGQVEPEALAILGATAGKALFGASFRIGDARGSLIESDLAPLVTATVHPSAILRTRDEQERRAERLRFTEDLAGLARALDERHV